MPLVNSRDAPLAFRFLVENANRPQRGNPAAAQGNALGDLVRVSGALKGRPNLLCGCPERTFYEGAYAGSGFPIWTSTPWWNRRNACPFPLGHKVQIGKPWYAGSGGTQLLGGAPAARLSSSHVRCAMPPVGLRRATVWPGVVICRARTPYNPRPKVRSRSIPHVPLVV